MSGEPDHDDRIAALERELDQVRRREAELSELIAATNDWLWSVDVNAVYTAVGERVRDFLGYAPEEVVGKTPFELMTPEEAARVAAIFGPIVAERRPFRGLVNTNVHRDGRCVVLETSGIPLFDTDGAFVGYRGVDRDITERVEAQAHALRLRDEIIVAQSTPLIPISETVVAVPLIGELDHERLERATEVLLTGIAARGARTVILDVTGVPQMHEAGYAGLVRIAHAIRLLGARMILTGISPRIAQTLVSLDLDLSAIETRATLRDGITEAVS